ncbi:MAG: TolC family protein [Cytophagales bacterium]|nr:TolC family protein [Cytophagales bacterium]
MRNPFLILLILFSIINRPAGAQDLDLSYDEAVKIALAQNVSLRTQKNDLKLVKAQRDQSRGEVAPTINANINGWRASGNTFIEQEARTINTTSKNMYGGLSANLNVFSGFQQMNMIKLRNANFEAQNYMIDRTAQEVIFTLSDQYLSVLLATELLEIAEDNLKTQKLLHTQIEAMVEAGNRPRSDLYDQLAVVKNRELLLLQAKNNLSNFKSNLAITLQLDPTVEISVSNPGWDLNEIRFLQLDLDELYDVSLANRPDLKQFESTEVVMEKAVSVSKANFSPSLGAYYNLSTRFNDQSVRDIQDQLTVDNKRTEYGLSLRIPIYNGLRNKTEYVMRKVNSENSKINTENLKKTILNDVRNAYQNFMDVRAAYEVSIAQQEAADMALKVQQEKYNLGVGSLIELTNANNNYVTAASGHAQARLNLLFQKVIMDYYTGALSIPSP